MDNKFIIIVSQYNAVDYIKQCLDSIMNQDYKNYEVVVVDDCSTDGTLDIVFKYPFHIVSHGRRMCSGALNTVGALSVIPIKENDIIVLLSGDDYLSDNGVLSYLNKVYQENILMTYGQYEPISGGYHNFCKPIKDIKGYRHSGLWLASHLITFKKKLWDLIDDNDLRAEDGEYGHYAFDVSILYPMIEMCGHKYHRFIDRVLYIYNDMNPTCAYKIFPKQNLNEADYFRNKRPYEELD